MRLQPDLEAARAYARKGEYRTLPVSTELLSDVRTPMRTTLPWKPFVRQPVVPSGRLSGWRQETTRSVPTVPPPILCCWTAGWARENALTGRSVIRYAARSFWRAGWTRRTRGMQSARFILPGWMSAAGSKATGARTPTSENRIAMIAREAEGFLYIVSSLGVTGVRSEITTDLDAMVRLVRQVTDVPCAIGFGISTPAQAQAIAALSDGAIVGSAIVKLIAEHGEEAALYAGAYVKAMKDAVAKA